MDVFTALNIKGPLTVSTAGDTSYELQVTNSTLSTTKVISQSASQGTNANNLVKVETFAPVTGTTAPTSGDVTIPGQIYINTSTSTSYIYTGSSFVALGDPSHENTIEHIYAGSSEVVPVNKVVTLGTAATGTTSTHAINSTNAGSSASTKGELATIGQVYTALTDGTVTKIGYTDYTTTDLGGTLHPIYLDNGVPTAGTQLYNKDITLNGSTTNHNVISQNNSFTLSFYAPTSAGTTGNILRANSNSAPGWEAPATTLNTTDSGYNGSKIPTSDVVNAGIAAAIAAIPTPMRFMGTVGTSGTIAWSSLPAASSAEGQTYKVITDHTSAPVCKAGDTIISNGTSWVVIPSGDEPDGTVKNIATGTGLTGGPITTTGEISIATANLLYREDFSNMTASSSVDCSLDNTIWTSGVVPRIVQVYTHTSKDLIMGDVDLSTPGHVTISFSSVPSESIDVNIIGW